MLTLLIAEDDPRMRAWLRTVLAHTGASIHEAGTGWEVLSLLATEVRFDLVVSDVRMPSPSGLQALAMARTAGSEVPFLLISAFGDQQLRAQAEVLRASFLDKPFSARELISYVERLAATSAEAP